MYIFSADDQRLARRRVTIVRDAAQTISRRAANNKRSLLIWRLNEAKLLFCGRPDIKLFSHWRPADGQSRSKRLRFYLLIDTCPALSTLGAAWFGKQPARNKQWPLCMFDVKFLGRALYVLMPQSRVKADDRNGAHSITMNGAHSSASDEKKNNQIRLFAIIKFK